MKYLKYFETEAGYASYKNGSDYVTPNVSYTVDSAKVYYNPVETVKSSVIMAHYSATEENKLAIADTSNVKSLKINGENVEFDEMYYFSEVGEYDVEIELIDPTLINGTIYDEDENLINNAMFMNDTEWVGACLTSVIIPDSVTYIGSYAFGGCSSLTSINIPDSVTSIDIGAFSDCSGLTSINIPDSVTTIGGDAFYSCSGLTSINIPDSVTSIKEFTFFDCSGLTEVTIGSDVTEIGEQAFKNCSSLTSINIPDSVTTIGGETFFNCSGLTEVTIGSDITEIGNNAFYKCSNLASITCFAPTAPCISYQTFYDIKQNGTLYVPSGSDYSDWTRTSQFYLGYYNWTIEYI